MPHLHRSKRARIQWFPYGGRRYLLSIAERRFWHALLSAVPRGCTIQCKVRLADIVFVRRESQRDKQHFNRIQAKHIDFVICDIATSAVRLAIELDDRSHLWAHRQRRDRFVDDLFLNVGVPLLRVPARRRYDVSDVSEKLVAALCIRCERMPK